MPDGPRRHEAADQVRPATSEQQTSSSAAAFVDGTPHLSPVQPTRDEQGVQNIDYPDTLQQPRIAPYA